MKALVVLSAVIAVVLSAPSVDKRYVRPGAYVPSWQQQYNVPSWQQQSNYYNSQNSGRGVYSQPRWYQTTARPLRYEASTLSPWLSQSKTKFSFGSAATLTPEVAVQPEAEQKVTIVESVPAVPRVPAGFGAFHFGKKSTPAVTQEEIKPIEIVKPEIEITKTIVQSSGSAEASLKTISDKDSVQTVVVAIPEEIKPAVVEAEIKSNAAVLAEDSEQLKIKSEETLQKVEVEDLSEKLNKTSVAIESTNVQEQKPLPISEIKSEVVAPLVIKKKHGFSFSYNPSSNNYNTHSLSSYSQAQPLATVPEIKPAPVIVIQAIQPAANQQLKPTLQPLIVESEKLETLQATTENIKSSDEYAVPTIDISQPIIQYVSPTEENKPVTLEEVPSTIEYVAPTLDISQPIIQYVSPTEENKPVTLEEVPSTIEYVVPTLDISQPIIQYASPSEENAPTTVESVQSTTEYISATTENISEYSPINSESIDALLSTLEPAIELTSTTESAEPEASTTEATPVTTDVSSNEYLQNDFEPAPSTVQSQVVESSPSWISEPLTSSVQSESAAILSSQSISYSSTPSVQKKKNGFSFSYYPSGYVYNKEALVNKPNSEVVASEIKVVAPAVTTSAPTIQYLQPVVSTVLPAANIWSNSFNTKKNGFSFSYNPTFSYFNKQPYYQPQVAVPAPVILSVPSAAPVVSNPTVESSSSHLEIAPVTIESTPEPEYLESTTALYEVSSEDAQSITTESSVSETTILNIEYGTTELEDKASIELDLASTTAESKVELETPSAGIESSNVAAESLSSNDKAAVAPLLISSSFAVPSVAPQVLPVANTWSNTYIPKKNAFSFSYIPSSFSFFNKPAYQQPIVQIVPVAASIPSVSESTTTLVPEIAESTTANELVTDDAEIVSSTTELYAEEATTLAIESNESYSTTQIPSGSVESVPAAIELSIKEVLNGQLGIASIPKESAPVVIESASGALQSENITQSLSEIKALSVTQESSSASVVSSPVLIESAPAAVASIQSVPVPLYVSKVSPPAAFPDIPSFVTKKHGFSFSYKPSGNYYNKPQLIAPVAPIIVNSSPVIASAAPAIAETAPVIASAAPAIAEPAPVIASAAPAIAEPAPVLASVAPAIIESSSVIASVAPTLSESSQEGSQSIFLSIAKALTSAILGEKTEKLAEAKPEIALIPSVVAESPKLNSEAEVPSQYDIAVKASPVAELKEVEILHDLRLGN